MTSQDARKQINECERQITEAFGSLREEAAYIGKNAVQEASRNKKEKVWRSVIVSLVGICLCVVGLRSTDVLVFAGIFLIIAGIALAYLKYRSADSVFYYVNKAAAELNAFLNANKKI